MPSARPDSAAPKTLSIGGATFDLFMETPNTLVHECGDMRAFALPLGRKIGVDRVTGACGGGANNTSVGLARLGCSAGISCVIGDDQWGGLIEDNLLREGVDTECLTVIESEQTSFSLILTSTSGERTILSHKHMDRHLHDVTFDREHAASVDGVYLNHLHEDSCVIEDDITAILTRTPDTHLTWNPGGRQIAAGIGNSGAQMLLSCTDLLLLNKEEALAFTGTSSQEEALTVLRKTGARIVCITDGQNGSMATDSAYLYRCPTLPCDTRDMTGAGDAFGTAMTWAILTGKDLPQALKAGTINAMSVVGKIGAQTGLLTHTQMQSELTKARIDVGIEPCR